MGIWIGATVVFLIGLAIGSFLNVCIYRLPREMSIIAPRSHCFHCNTELAAIDLVPVVSWLLLRGRCRFCGARISGRYALVELTTGLILAGLWVSLGERRGLPAEVGWTPFLVDFLAQGLFACVLIPIFMIDLEHYIIPTELNVIGILIGLGWDLARWATGQYQPVTLSPLGLAWQISLPPSAVGMLLGSGIFWGVVVLGSWVFRREAMGGGDVRFAAAAGAFFGPTYAFLTFFLLSILLGAVIGLILIALRLRSRRDYIPFGPFMVLSALALMFGEPFLVAWVRGRFGG